MLHYLDAEIEKRKTEVANIEDKQERLQQEQERLQQRWHDLGVELRLLQDIRTRSVGDERTENRDRSRETDPGKPSPAVTRSKLAAHWRVVLREAVERHPEAVKTHEVPEIQLATGHDVSPAANVRSHFHKLRHQGFYEDAGWGAVRATKAAAEYLGIPLGHTNHDTGASIGQSLFGEPEREAAGRAHEANPTASIHH